MEEKVLAENMPERAKKVWEEVYNQALKNGKSKEIAAATAWTAVKNGWKKDDKGNWVRKSEYSEFSAVITKASTSDGERRIRMSASDTGYDVFGERMSVELFKNFVRRITEPVPEILRDVLQEKSGWAGGMPYTSISHYRSGTEAANVPADTTKVYVDGEVLKSVAVVRDTPLGNALWTALKADIDGTSTYKDKIRVSIGFIDLKHSHGSFVFTRDTLESRCPMCENSVEKTYLDGILVHNAFTRKPANPRTLVEVERMAEEIKTREDDADSIVGSELRETVLDVNKSTTTTTEDILVVKTEQTETPAVEEKAFPPVSSDEELDDDHPEDCTCKACMSKKKEEKTALDVQVEKLKARITELKALPREEALAKLQDDFNALAEVVKSEFPEPAPVPVVEAKIDPALAELLTAIKSAVEQTNNTVSKLQEEVAVLKAAKPVVAAETPAPRNLQVNRSVAKPVEANKVKSIVELARQSVGLS